MLPNINSQNEIIQQDFKTPLHYTSLHGIDLQSKVQQGNKKQQSQENRSVEGLDIDGVDTKEVGINTNDHTSISSNGSLSNGSTASTGQEVIKPVKTNDKKIDAMTKALAEIDNGIESIEKNTIEEEVESDNSIYDDIYEKREIKPRLIVGSSDINYKRDKGGNHRMTLMYCSDNSIRFSKDDDPVIIIKNDNVKGIGGFDKFCSEIEKWCEQKTDESKKQQMSHPVSKQKECEQKIDEGKKYYFEDYLKARGFIKEQKEEKIDISKKLDEIMSLLIDESSLEM